MLSRSILTALLTLTAPLALAQPPAPPPESPPVESPPAEQAPPVARDLTQAEIIAFNRAVTAFTAGQTAQQKGDNETAAAQYDAALPAIRTAVEADPANSDNVHFLANALYAAAAAHGALGQRDQVIPLYEEALPHWRRIVEAKPADATSRNILAGILIQIGNHRLADHDRAGADPYYAEALPLARKGVEEQPGDPAARNILLSALIGAGQTSTEEGMLEEALTMGKAMIADGSIDASNRPTLDAMSGTAG
ncbi:hypothetical protein Q4610_05500 [Sphingobium sp. HBC34]|uniref:Tetratricopeptide repeat protein n=1 Tax=Sphingobium cyanobacteriorum TaxID=3063954 RepID=A0ABT8ZJ78_9SPHN|nr:hypothetical protein [Sphingobium sp. HBC34]MDO7834496.1 hypothetical protein [Sphingobium sp. HBC34]